MTDLTQVRMTAAEFKQLPESSDLVELINGELVFRPCPKDPHQRTVGNLALLLDRLVATGRVLCAPLDNYLDDLNVIHTDVLWINEVDIQQKLGDDGYLHGAPDLAIEIVSPPTEIRDRQVKFDLYEQFGVREYWLVDPLAQYLEVWKLVEDKFERGGVFGPADKFNSAVLGQTVDVSAVFTRS